jgi:hypothetical protein
MKIISAAAVLLVAALAWKPLARTAPLASNPTGGSGIACRVLEGGVVASLGVGWAIFHQRDAGDGDSLGAFLRARDGTVVEFETTGGARVQAQLARLKSCFGRGLLLYPAPQAHLAAQDEFTLERSAVRGRAGPGAGSP